MEVGVCSAALPLISLRHVVVDDNVDALNVDTPSNQVSSHKNALLALLELLVDVQPVLPQLS